MIGGYPLGVQSKRRADPVQAFVAAAAEHPAAGQVGADPFGAAVHAHQTRLATYKISSTISTTIRIPTIVMPPSSCERIGVFVVDTHLGQYVGQQGRGRANGQVGFWLVRLPENLDRVLLAFTVPCLVGNLVG